MDLSFFSVSGKKPSGRPKTSLNSLSCESCGLFKSCRSPKMDWHGEGKKSILVLGEGPGATEDEAGEQWVGEAGQFLNESLAEVGISLNRDCWKLNAVNCRTSEDNRKPTNHEIAACRHVKVRPALQSLKPKYILVFGDAALKSIYGDRRRLDLLQITRFQGRIIPDISGAWIMPMLHPSFIKRMEFNEDIKALWKRNLARVAREVARGVPPEIPDPKAEFEIVTEFGVLERVLRSILDKSECLVFDYETTGLKPWRPGHKIVSVSCVAYMQGFGMRLPWGEEVSAHGYSFPLDYPGAWTKDERDKIVRLWKQILSDGRIKKVAQNQAFEDMWSRKVLDLPQGVRGWEWDTMIGCHIADNTPGMTGLKVQSWLWFGLEPWDDEFERYREVVPDSKDKKPTSLGFNRVQEMPLDKLLEYGGIDSVTTAYCYERQKRLVARDGRKNAYVFMQDFLHALMDVQCQGIPISEQYYQREEERLTAEMSQLLDRLSKSRESKLFEQKEGRALFPPRNGREVALPSNKDLGILLYTHLGFSPFKHTAGGSASVDAESLHHIKIPFTEGILKVRETEKVVSTYFKQIVRESWMGKVYPNTKLHGTRTYRPSMDTPNLANLAKRKKEAKILVRSGIVAEKGFRLMECDYKGIEVHGLEWYSKDEVLRRYLLDPKSDMHRDEARQIFNFTEKEWDELADDTRETLRFHAKNGWVFPAFYGDYYRSCAARMWDRLADQKILPDGTTVKKWLGMSYLRFEEHMRQHERVFWSKFRGVRDWQDSVSKEYREKGYIETYLGFRFGGYMEKNKLYNYKVQGTAFHVLAWSFGQLQKEARSRGWKSRLLWQVYDAIITMAWPPELKDVMEAHQRIMVDGAKRRFGFINTPISIVLEVSSVDGNYAELAKLDDIREGSGLSDEEEEE